AEVQRRLPGVAVLLMSGYSSELLDADRESPPSWELLRKPFARGELSRAIAKVLGGQSEAR
ncbi:MAG TPA: hybrid sensor histidine kinase/response regulator, partial [Burkholderiaceae bacterium]